MGDASDAADIDRLMRSSEGNAHLVKLKDLLLKRRITDVRFMNDVHAIKVVLCFDDGSAFAAYPPELDISALRETFDEVIEREYRLDHASGCAP